MAKALISSPLFLGTPLPSLSDHGFRRFPYRRLNDTRVRFSIHEVPPLHQLDNSIDFHGVFTRAESLLYTLADAADSAAAAAAGSTDAAVQKNGGWFGFISEAMEAVLKVLKDGLTAAETPSNQYLQMLFLAIA